MWSRLLQVRVGPLGKKSAGLGGKPYLLRCTVDRAVAAMHCKWSRKATLKGPRLMRAKSFSSHGTLAVSP